MSNGPKITDDEMYQLLRNHNVAEFNERRSKGEAVELHARLRLQKFRS